MLAQGPETESVLHRINMDNHAHQTIKTKSMNRLGFKIVGKILSYFASDLEYTLDDARVFIANPDPALFRSIFNLSDIPLVKNIRNIVLLDRIRFNLKFHFSPNLMEKYLTRASRLKPLVLTPASQKSPNPDDRQTPLMFGIEDILIPGMASEKEEPDNRILIRLLCNYKIDKVKDQLVTYRKNGAASSKHHTSQGNEEGTPKIRPKEFSSASIGGFEPEAQPGQLD